MGVGQILSEYAPAFVNGLSVTARLTLLVWGIGLSLGIPLGVGSNSFRRWIGVPFRAVAFLLSAIPVLVFLYWAHYPLQVLLQKVIDPFITAVAVLAILNIFAVADQVEGILRDVPQQYAVAARVCGLPPSAILLKIQLPLVARQLIPALLPIQVYMLQSSLFASLISVEEILRVSQRVNAAVYRPVEIYTALALFFIAICLPINLFAAWLKRRYTRDLSER